MNHVRNTCWDSSSCRPGPACHPVLLGDKGTEHSLPWASFTLGVPVGTGTQEPFNITLKVGSTSFSATEPHTVLWRCLTSHSLRPQRARRLTAKSMPLGSSRGPCLRAGLVAQAPHPREKEPPRSPAQPSVPVVLTEPAKGWSQLSEKGYRI